MTFSGKVVDVVVLSRPEVLSGEKRGLGSYLERSEDFDELKGRATTFSGEVVDLMVLSRARA